MKYLLLVALLCVECCFGEQKCMLQTNRSVRVKSSTGSVTVSIVEIDGHKYCVLVGLNKAAICPAAETIRWANQQQPTNLLSHLTVK